MEQKKSGSQLAKLSIVLMTAVVEPVVPEGAGVPPPGLMAHLLPSFVLHCLKPDFTN